MSPKDKQNENRAQQLRYVASLQHAKWAQPMKLPDSSMPTAQTLRPVAKVELYLLQIYELLNRLDACFYSGAIVVEDPQGQLFSLLLSARSRERLPGRTKFGTHRKFMKEQDCSQWTSDSSKCNRQFEIDLDGLLLTCRNAEQKDRRNILLFYGFNGPNLSENNAKQPLQRYVYLKLETSSYASATHVFSASKHYGQKWIDKRMSSQKDSVESTFKPKFVTRREGDTDLAQLTSKIDFSKYYCPLVQRTAASYDQKMRKGAEFFLPYVVSAALLKQIDNVFQLVGVRLDGCPT